MATTTKSIPPSQLTTAQRTQASSIAWSAAGGNGSRRRRLLAGSRWSGCPGRCGAGRCGRWGTTGSAGAACGKAASASSWTPARRCSLLRWHGSAGSSCAPASASTRPSSSSPRPAGSAWARPCGYAGSPSGASSASTPPSRGSLLMLSRRTALAPGTQLHHHLATDCICPCPEFLLNCDRLQDTNYQIVYPPTASCKQLRLNVAVLKNPMPSCICLEETSKPKKNTESRSTLRSGHPCGSVASFFIV